jgi:hypothetical protein
LNWNFNWTKDRIKRLIYFYNFKLYKVGGKYVGGCWNTCLAGDIICCYTDDCNKPNDQTYLLESSAFQAKPTSFFFLTLISLIISLIY